eukprot:7671780-Prorocentrum_lima.AAC.1
MSGRVASRQSQETPLRPICLAPPPVSGASQLPCSEGRPPRHPPHRRVDTGCAVAAVSYTHLRAHETR